MALKKLAAIIDRVDEIVWDTTATVFTDAKTTLAVAGGLAELSKDIPYKVTEVLTTTANSKVLDISSISDLIEIKRLEYPTGNDPRSYKNFTLLDKDTIEILTDTTPEAGGSGSLTGTVTFATGSAAITGSGTAFTTELAEGYHIKRYTSGTGRWYRIYSIESDTALTLAEPCRSGDTGADTVNKTYYCYETVYLYCHKLHTITDAASSWSTLPDYATEEYLCHLVAANMIESYAREKVGAGGTAGRSGWQAYVTLAQKKLERAKSNIYGHSEVEFYEDYAR